MMREASFSSSTYLVSLCPRYIYRYILTSLCFQSSFVYVIEAGVDFSYMKILLYSLSYDASGGDSCASPSSRSGSKSSTQDLASASAVVSTLFTKLFSMATAHTQGDTLVNFAAPFFI